MTKPAIKITAILGSLILLVTAGFHMTALPQVEAVLTELEPGFFQGGLMGAWILPSVHWLFIAFLSIGLSRYKSNACAAILMAFGCWVIIDALITFIHVGPFVGPCMLGFAGALLLASGLMLRKEMKG